MGAYVSANRVKILGNTNVNYDCPTCMSSGRLPNIAGKFFIINDTQCQCNGCNTIYEKSRFYKSYTENAVNVERVL